MMDQANSDGRLFLVATPIGNLGDMTFRAVETLKEVDLIAAEDTRRAAILLKHYGISKSVTSYHAFNEHRKTEWILGQVRNGLKVALITDAGTPGIADPGFLLAREALKAGIEPIAIPGVSALTFASTVSGLPSDRFAFYGFLPPKSGRKRQAVEMIARENKTVIIFESPHKLTATLQVLEEVMGCDVPLVLIREATKLHEEIVRGSLGEVRQRTAQRTWKGEIVLVIGVRPEKDDIPPELPD